MHALFTYKIANFEHFYQRHYSNNLLKNWHAYRSSVGEAVAYFLHKSRD
jgi:hypothetical protein